MVNESTARKIDRFFSSVKLTIVLLTLIILGSVIGTFIPQGLEPLEYIQRYGSQGYSLFSLIGFTDIYHSWWFIFLLFLLGLNLLLCSLNRIKMRKRARGLIITHLSILLVLSGAIVSAVWGERGFMPLYEGETKDFFVMKDNRIQKLDFKISLDDFVLEWYNSEHHQITAYVKDRNIKKILNVKEGISYYIEGTNYSFQTLRYIPDFYLDQNKEAKTRTDAPNNPAFLVRITNNQTDEERWLFSKFPAFSNVKDQNIDLSYKWLGNIKDFKSKLRVIEADKTVLTKTIEVNHPLKYKGYTFYQSNYNPEELNWSSLEVVKDPGVPLVYAGFILMNIGIILVFYIRRGTFL